MVESIPVTHPLPGDNSFGNVLVQRMACQQAAWPSGYHLHNWNEMVHGLPYPTWDHYSKETTFPWQTSRAAQDYQVVQAEETVPLAKAPPKMHSPLWDASWGVLQNECRNFTWVSLTYVIQSGNMAWPWKARHVAEKDPVDPYLWRESTIDDAQGGPTCQCNHPLVSWVHQSQKRPHH